MNTRPTSAGLKGFFPNPPNDIFAIPMATIEPMTIIHQGSDEGMLNARSTPVRTAEPSLIVHSPLIKYFCIIHSVSTQLATAIAVTRMASHPKKYIDDRNAGTSARVTVYMILFTLSSPWICGEPDIVNLFISYF